MSVELFLNMVAKAKIPVEALKWPDVALQDYGQRAILLVLVWTWSWNGRGSQ